jgi:hypothetical protein
MFIFYLWNKRGESPLIKFFEYIIEKNLKIIYYLINLKIKKRNYGFIYRNGKVWLYGRSAEC